MGRPRTHLPIVGSCHIRYPRIFLISLLATIAVYAAACAPRPQPILIDDFESGQLSGWETQLTGSGSWYVYTDGKTPPNPATSDPTYPFNVPNPPQGKYAAVTDMDGPGTRILYKELQLDGPYQLQLTLYYVNSANLFASPDYLTSEGENLNQQFRIDLLDPSAPVDTIADQDILATIFQTAPGDPKILAPVVITFDLSPWDGQVVVLRLANTDNIDPLRVGVDNIRLVP